MSISSKNLLNDFISSCLANGAKMPRERIRRSFIRQHHWLLLVIYLFPLGYLFFCLHQGPDNKAIVRANVNKSVNIENTISDTSMNQTCDISHLGRHEYGDICAYIESNCDQDIFKFSKLYFCSYEQADRLQFYLRFLLCSTIFITILIIFMIFGLITSNFLYPNLDRLSKYLNISSRISGLTLLSLGNATPDIFSTYNAFSSNSSSLAIGELLGSANFVICFVIGSMGIIKPFEVNHYEFLKDLGFFMILISISIYFIQDEKLMTFECVMMMILYLIYVNYSIFFTNEGKETEELLSIMPNDEESLLSPTYSNERHNFTSNPHSPLLDPEVSSIISSIDHNKTKGLQKFSLFDAVALWRAMSTDLQESPMKPPSLARIRSSDQLPSPSPAGGTIPQADDESRTRAESEPPLPQSSSLVPIISPLPIPIPSLILEDPEANISTPVLLEPPPPSPMWTYLFRPTTPTIREARQLDAPSLLLTLTYPLLLILNLLIPVYPKHINPKEHESLIAFKKRLFLLQILLIPSLFFFYFRRQSANFLPNYTPIPITLILLVINYFLPHTHTIPTLGFITSLLFIIVSSAHLISLLKNIGVISHISEALLGLTVLALGNSMGDLISNLTLAELDLSVVGINACFGSPLIYILVGVGINGLLVNLRSGQEYLALDIGQNFKASSVGIVVMLIFYAVVIPWNGWVIDRKIGAVCVTWWLFITGVNVYLETQE